MSCKALIRASIQADTFVGRVFSIHGKRDTEASLLGDSATRLLTVLPRTDSSPLACLLGLDLNACRDAIVNSLVKKGGVSR